MTFLTNFMSINLTELYFETFREKLFNHFPQILTYDVILAPKICQNGQNWVILGAKIRSYVKIWESGQIIFSLNVSKNYISQVNGHKFSQMCN